ncbi:hypothetical protein [Alloactinosynnema sp. L-07]|uniref:hypothetical protein n=1 Tax=Alloactinosynnema sp. L-07 TaxID=1653480 RepID=UPI0012F9E515|nr:hypothetical protein [Alloactinosynnema sp. L-07]
MNFRQRLGEWVLDGKQFVVWVAIALTVGAIPDLAVSLSWILLLAIWVVAGFILFLSWYRDRKREGVGVYVHIPIARDARNDRDGLIEAVHKKIGKNHRGWFRSGPDFGSATTVDLRVDWAMDTIKYRLAETSVQVGFEPAIFLYLHCRLEEAFILGRRAKVLWGQQSPFVFDDPHTVSSGSMLNLGLCVRSISTFVNPDGDIYQIDFRKVSQQTNDEPLAVTVESEALSSSDEGRPPRVALILHAAEGSGNYSGFKKAALMAAEGGPSGGYNVGPEDRCDSALVVSITADALIEGLKAGNAEKFIRQIHREYLTHCRQRYGADNVSTRVFAKSPAILSFALGAMLPNDSAFIPWDREAAAATSRQDQFLPDVVAIVDGDDVGASMELPLLELRVADAVRFSRQVSETLDLLVVEASNIAGVKLISHGGDSAIFGLKENSLGTFEGFLADFRVRNSFSISCGVGADSRQALLALRLAKSSGKNRTSKAL